MTNATRSSATVYQSRRQLLEAYIEAMIALLDDMDGDENLEDGHDAEPSFGIGRYHDGKMEYDLEQDLSDYEYDLGWSNPRFPGDAGNPVNPNSYLPLGWSCSDVPTACQTGDFRGEGQHIARAALKKAIKDPRKREKALDATRLPVGFGSQL